MTESDETMKYPEDYINKPILGDSRELLKPIPDESIDLIATDPQYGWNFMSKDWDKALPHQDIYNDCFRVLKSGAFMFWMSGARLDNLIENGIRIRSAGFRVDFTPIFWTYASGFPKAQNVSKTIDKQACKKELTEKLGRNPTKEEFEKAWKGFREVIGTKNNTYDDSVRSPEKHKPPAELSNIGKWGLTQTPHGMSLFAPSTDQAKVLDRSYAGFQPKPAVEVVMVAMKPMSEKTYVDQALKNEKGITWLDDGRIPFQSENDKERHIRGANSNRKPRLGAFQQSKELINDGVKIMDGRFPPNLLVEDDVLNDGKEYKTGDVNPTGNPIYGRNSYFKSKTLNTSQSKGDSGSFSRYFDLDAWFEEKLRKLPEEVQKTFPFLIVPKASKSEKNKGLEDFLLEKEIGHNRFDKCKICGGYLLQNPNRPSACKCINPIRENNKMKGNIHPTVKPIKLFSYLITIATRKGDTVLDPFIGSGTTAIAAIMLNRKFIGIEIDPENYQISKARIKDVMRQTKL